MGKHSTPRWEQLSSLLRTHRDRLHLTQEEAGARAGVSKQTWSNLEHVPTARRSDGKPYKPRRPTLIRAAQAVEVDPDVVLHLAGYAALGHVERSELRGGVTTSQRRLSEKMTHLPARTAAALESLVDVMLGEHPGPGPWVSVSREQHIPPVSEDWIYAPRADTPAGCAGN